MPISSSQGSQAPRPVLTVELQVHNGHTTARVFRSPVESIQPSAPSANNNTRVTSIQSMRDSFFSDPRTQVFRNSVALHAKIGVFFILPASIITVASVYYASSQQGETIPAREWFKTMSKVVPAAFCAILGTGCATGAISQWVTNSAIDRLDQRLANSAADTTNATATAPASEVPQVIVEQPGLETARDTRDGAMHITIGVAQNNSSDNFEAAAAP